MPRTIEHTAFVHRTFADVCRILSRHPDEIFGIAATAAWRRSTDLVEGAERELAGFDSLEAVRVQLAPFVHDELFGSLELTFEADRAKRLLANVEARIDVRPLVRKGPAATTEINLRAQYLAHPGHRHSPEAVLFGRRVVKASLHQFLDALVTSLDNYEESIFA